MRRVLALLLDGLILLALGVALLILLTGGTDISTMHGELSARGLANPVAIALVAAALRRWLQPVERSQAARLWATLRDGARRAFGPGLERLRGTLVLRADAIVLALFAAFILDLGAWMPIRIEGDGVGYYAYLRSPLMDRDLDFHNEYRDFDPRQQWLGKRTRLGRTENPFAIGPALLWLPFFVAGWGGARALDAAGVPVAIDGYSPPFLYAVATGSWIYGLAGVVLLYRLLLAHHERRVAMAASLTAVMASPLGYYLPYSPFMSHIQSFFASVLFLWAWVRTPPEAPVRRWLLLGLAGALVALTRWQDAVLWIVPAVSLLAAAVAGARDRRLGPALARVLPRGLAFLAGMLVGVFPQLLVFRLLNGFWLGVPQGGRFVDNLPRYLWPTLFSWNHGLYTWTPLLIVATLGLLVAALARRPWAGAWLIGFLAVLYANGCVWQWWAGHSFGARRFASAVPFFALGLAEIYRRVAHRRVWFAGALSVAAVAVAVNLALMRLFVFNRIPHGTAIDPLTTARACWRLLTNLEWTTFAEPGGLLDLFAERLSGLTGERFPLVAGAALLYAVARYRTRARG